MSDLYALNVIVTAIAIGAIVAAVAPIIIKAIEELTHV